MAAGLLRYGTGILKAALEDKMGLDRRQFFKTIAVGAVAASLPAVAVGSDITPKDEPSKRDRQKFAKFFKAAATGSPAAIQACKDEGIEMKQVTDGGFGVEKMANICSGGYDENNCERAEIVGRCPGCYPSGYSRLRNYRDFEGSTRG